MVVQVDLVELKANACHLFHIFIYTNKNTENRLSFTLYAILIKCTEVCGCEVTNYI